MPLLIAECVQGFDATRLSLIVWDRCTLIFNQRSVSRGSITGTYPVMAFSCGVIRTLCTAQGNVGYQRTRGYYSKHQAYGATVASAAGDDIPLAVKFVCRRQHHLAFALPKRTLFVPGASQAANHPHLGVNTFMPLAAPMLLPSTSWIPDLGHETRDDG